MRWRKRQLDIIKVGLIEKKTRKAIYKELFSLSDQNSDFELPSFEEFQIKYQDIEDLQDFYTVSDLSEILKTSTKTIKRWFQDYEKTLNPVEGKGTEVRYIKRFINTFPGEIVRNCEPDLLWLIDVLR